MSATILVVEDDEKLARMYQKVLLHAGHEILLTGYVSEAIELFSTHQPPIVCLDWRLLDGSGGGFLKFLETVPLEQRPRVLVISAEVTRADVEDYRDLIAGFYNKPLAVKEMVDIILGQ